MQAQKMDVRTSTAAAGAIRVTVDGKRWIWLSSEDARLLSTKLAVAAGIGPERERLLGSIGMIVEEVERATSKYPNWPTDIIHAAAIVAEETGELVREANLAVHEAKMNDECVKGAVQTGAMAVRFLLNYDKWVSSPDPQARA